MTKYCLSLNGLIIHAVKKEHKKSGLWYYDPRMISSVSEGLFEIALFDTKTQAYSWLLRNSSFPRFVEYMSSPSITEELLENLYLKGRYYFIKVNLSCLRHYNFIQNTASPLLCEIIVQEYNG